MASNLAQSIVPALWNSANDNIIYEFSFNYYGIVSTEDYIVGSTSTGFTKFTLYTPLDIAPIVGEEFLIFGGIYDGTYTINTVISPGVIVLETAYIGTVTPLTSLMYHLRVPIFSLYKGFAVPSDDWTLNLPYTKVVPIKPSIVYTDAGIPYISINVKGLTKYIFNIESNLIANSIDYSMFNAIDISWDGLTTSFSAISSVNLVLNTVITTEDLTLNYLGGGRYFTPNDKPFIASQGVTFATTFGNVFIDGTYPKLHKFINGVKI